MMGLKLIYVPEGGSLRSESVDLTNTFTSVEMSLTWEINEQNLVSPIPNT